MAQREEIPAHEWRLDGSNIVGELAYTDKLFVDDTPDGFVVGFTENADSSKFIPTELSTPSAVLKGTLDFLIVA